MKWPLRILAGVGAMLLCLALVSVYLTSEPGTRWLLQQLPDSIQIGESRGSLLDRLTLTDLRILYPGGQITLAQAELQWDPWAALGGTLHLSKLHLDQLTIVTDPAAPTEASDAALELPQLSLPLPLLIDDVRLEQLTLNSGGERILLLTRAQLRASAFLHRVQLKTLSLERPEGQLQLKGGLRLSGDYPLELETDWRLSSDELGSLNGQGTLAGSVQALKMRQRVRGDLNATVDLTIEPLSAALNWQGRLRAEQIALGRWLPDAAALRVNADIDARGDRHQLAAQLHLTTRHPEYGLLQLEGNLGWQDDQLNITRAILQQPQQRRHVSAEGVISRLRDQPHFDLRGDWKALGYPLDSPQYQSPEGRYQVQGDLNQLQLTLAGALAEGPNNPAAQLRVNATGTLDGLSALDATADTLGGTLRYLGRLDWQQQLAWDGRLSVTSVDPSWFNGDWPGSLNGQLLSAGNLDAFSAELITLTGQLRDQPLTASAKLFRAEDRWTIQSATASLKRKQQLTLSGTIDSHYDLRWQLSTGALPPWVEGLSGSLGGKGRLLGPLTAPRIGADVTVRSLHYAPLDFNAKRASAQIAVDLNPQAPSLLRLRVEAPAIGPHQWQQAQLQVKGTLSQHQAAFKLTGEPLTLDAGLSGGWNAAQWQGTLRRLALTQPQAGSWRLAAPAALSATAERVELASTCLIQQQAESCIQARWQPDALDSRLTIKRLAIAPWTALVLPNSTRGHLNVDASLQQQPGEPLELNAAAQISGLQVELEPELWLSIDQLNAAIRGDEQRLSVRSDATSSELDGRLSLDGEVTDPLAAAQWQASLQGRLADLRLLSLASPDLHSPTGILEVATQLQGDRSQFRWNGELNLREGAVELPATGIRLEQITLNLREDSALAHHLLLTGSAQSGDGVVSLSGRFDTTERQFNLAIQGENFLAAATPTARVLISPDLTLELTPGRLQIDGSVTIPQALLTPPELSGRVGASNDVIFVDQQDSAGSLPFRYNARIRLILGDQVRFEGFGVKSRLEGNLLITDNATSSTRASGTIQVARGRYRLYGQDLDIERGRFIYSGGPIENPGLDLRIRRNVEEVEVGAQVSGTLQQSELRLFSNPSMPDPELLSYLILGRPPGATSTDEQALALRAAIALGTSGGNKLGERLTESLPVDDLGLDSDTAENTSFYVGKYLSPSLYVRYGVGLIEPTTTFFIRYKLSEKWNFESQTGTKSSAADLIYTIER